MNQTANILNQNCPSRTVLRHLTDRWTPMIVAVLATDQTVRFTELRKKVEGISPKVLTETLRSMERDGLVVRTATPSIPPKVEYSLTELGKTTIEPLNALRRWAEEHVAQVEENRLAFDENMEA